MIEYLKLWATKKKKIIPTNSAEYPLKPKCKSLPPVRKLIH